MAEAIRIPAPLPTPPPDRIQLTLSLEEATAIQCLMAYVNGSHVNGPRKHTQAVYDALKRAGVDYFDSNANKLVTGFTGFKDGPTL